ncbi:MAG: dehydrogenase/reductase SDR family protein 7B [Psychromonas sp.]
MSNSFQNKVIWIIGASSGIGKECAVQLAKEGAVLILSSRQEDKLLEVKKSISLPDSHKILPLDLENLDGVEDRLLDLLGSNKKIDFLINNGGLSQRSTAFDTSMDVDRRIMEINYFGNIRLTKMVLPLMRKNGSGHIVVLSSIAGKFGFFLRSAYSASKHALHGFYESLRLEEENNNIHVTIACPGKINTDISLNALTGSGDQHGVMDHNQSTGMGVEECVRQLLQAVKGQKKEVLIGGKEIKAVTLKRFFPSLFYKIIKKQPAT